VVLTKDESRNVGRALASIPAGSETLVIDAESTDDTAELARSTGARVVVRPWPGFVSARRAALDLVFTPWTFMLDADEALESDLRRALADVAPDEGVDAYAVRRTTFFCGRPIRHGPWGGDAPVRFFRTARASLLADPVAGGDAEVHERWTVPGRVESLAGALSHFSYPTVAAYRAKFERYTSLEARGVLPSRRALARALAVAALRAPWYLVVKGGWRDGWRGAFVSVASAWYPVAVAWKALRYAR
jgi:glycosyltransferase involved in cell wall biosynthesis